MSRFLTTWRAAFGLLTLVLQVAMSPPVDGAEADGIVFHDDYNKAIREAKLAKKPIFLEFRCAP